MKLIVVGQDPSLRHWGLAKGIFDTETRQLTLTKLHLIEPVLSKGKQVRQNSLDLESAKQLCEGAAQFTRGAHAAFIEVPIGSQSARAMASYGICVGVIGSLRSIGFPVFEVTPTEVKLAGPGKANASKEDMISWAIHKHPEGAWPTYKENGEVHISTTKAEHLSDATAAIYAGVASNQFHQLLAIQAAHS